MTPATPVTKTHLTGTTPRKRPHILVISCCTGAKLSKPPGQLTIDNFRQGPDHVQARKAELQPHLTNALRMYTGQQHMQVSQAFELLNKTVDPCVSVQHLCVTVPSWRPSRLTRNQLEERRLAAQPALNDPRRTTRNLARQLGVAEVTIRA